MVANRINLKLLQTFLLVAETRSFREAADQVSRSQSAISTQIKQLEDQLGIPLFNRTTRSVELTPEGQELLAHARRALAEVDRGLRTILEAADLRRGRVTMACAPTLAATRLPAILAAFERHHPGIRIVVQELKSADLFQRVRQGEVDFGLGPVVHDGALDVRTVLREPLHLFGTERFLPREAATAEFDTLADLPLIQFGETTVMGRLVAQVARDRGIALNTRYECVQGQTLVALATAGLGVAIMIGSMAQVAAGPGMRRPRIVAPALTQDFAILTLKGKAMPPAAGQLVKMITERISADLQT